MLHNAVPNSNFEQIRQLRNEVQASWPRGLDIEEVICLSRNQDASDPRDRIYGLLGLLSPDSEVKIEVDYAKSVDEVYRDVMISVLVGRNDLSFLAAKEHEMPFCNTDGDVCSCKFNPSKSCGASWIPNFNSHDHEYHSHVHSAKNVWQVRSQWMGSKDGYHYPLADLEMQPGLKFNGFSLFARGVLLDVVQHTTRWDEPDTSNDRKHYDWSICSPVPVVEFLWRHAGWKVHQESQSTGQGDCCLSCAHTETYLCQILQILDRLDHPLCSKCYQERKRPRKVHSSMSDGRPLHSEKTKLVTSRIEALSQNHLQKEDCINAENLAQTMAGSLWRRRHSDEEKPPIIAPIEICFPDRMWFFAPEYDKCCSVYQPRNAALSNFWEAVWRTLVGREQTGENCPYRSRGDELLLWILTDGIYNAYDPETCSLLNSGYLSDGNSDYGADGDQDDGDDEWGDEEEDGSHAQKESALHALKGVWQRCEEAFADVQGNLRHTLEGRRVFVTQNRWMGVGPHILQPGDVVAMLFGGNVPYILRPVDNHYILVGECYVHGIMNGEPVREFMRCMMDGVIEGTQR
ncbi:hypothetical protein BKA64DRAFT_477296 [Cadophora sp. MPI-SDFR-AT-0126]|nr:hypothetical protein BKA64DRAFT_477296 [Leotiomycetes sp. MPI-SDFR-AT-0126]